MTGHLVGGGCARFNGAHVTDRLLRDGRAVLGIDWFEDYYPRPITEGESVPARDHAVFKELRNA